MATTPTIERTEESQCSVCSQSCIRLCVRCGTHFCNKHLLAHSGECNHKYYGVIRTILRDEIKDMLSQLAAFAVRSL